MFLYVTYNQACRSHFYEFQLLGNIKDLFGPSCLRAHGDISSTTHLPNIIMYGVLKINYANQSHKLQQTIS